MSQAQERTQQWQRLVAQVEAEYAGLGVQERRWIHATCHKIGTLQGELDRLFLKADGPRECGDCRGDCCALGHNHLTLANLLFFLSRGETPPALDFAETCPLLGAEGCILSAQQRPYACISFLCDRLEQQLSAADVVEFYRLEAELRRLYYSFAARYAGGGMFGLLLAARRLQGQPFLTRLAT